MKLAGRSLPERPTGHLPHPDLPRRADASARSSSRSPSAARPHGAKGVGELPMDVVAPAVVDGHPRRDRGLGAPSCRRRPSASSPRCAAADRSRRSEARAAAARWLPLHRQRRGRVEVAVPGMRRLLDVLREDLGLTGTKEGCGEGECGACSVLLDGRVVDSLPGARLPGRGRGRPDGRGPGRGRARLPEPAAAGLPRDGRRAVRHLHAGHADGRAGLPRRRRRRRARTHIREAIAGNLCRCTGYTKIIEAIELAALGGGGAADAAALVAGPDLAGLARGRVGMSVEPPVVGPATLPRPSSSWRGGGYRPLAGGTDLHGPAGGRRRRAARRGHRPVAARRAARHRLRRLRGLHRRAHDVHGAAPLPGHPGTPAGARGGGGHDRRGADPEPRHDRGQHLQRLPGG